MPRRPAAVVEATPVPLNVESERIGVMFVAVAMDQIFWKPFKIVDVARCW